LSGMTKWGVCCAPSVCVVGSMIGAKGATILCQLLKVVRRLFLAGFSSPCHLLVARSVLPFLVANDPLAFYFYCCCCRFVGPRVRFQRELTEEISCTWRLPLISSNQLWLSDKNVRQQRCGAHLRQWGEK